MDAAFVRALPGWIMVLLFGFVISGHVQADIYVIINSESPVKELSATQIADIALGRPVKLAQGVRLQFVDQSTSRLAFHEFHYGVTGMSEVRLNSYWARRVFTGRGLAPRRLKSDAAVLRAIYADPSLLGYVAEPPTPDNKRLRVLLQVSKGAKF